MGRYGGFANQAGAMMHADFDRTEKLAGEPSAHRDNRQWQTLPNQRSPISGHCARRGETVAGSAKLGQHVTRAGPAPLSTVET